MKNINTVENRKFLTDLIGQDIVYIKTRKYKHKPDEVIYFWPHFWWYRQRSSMDLYVFNKLIGQLN